MLDNYDSFVFNLVQYFGELGARCFVVRNDRMPVADVLRLRPAAIVLSPGPRTPAEAGIAVDLVRAAGGRVPVLGVCLGHQAIGVAYGARVGRAARPVHGKTSRIHHDGRGVFAGLRSPLEAARYHSLIVERSGLPECLEVSAWTKTGEIMGLRHRESAVEGVQFHPESILTACGRRLLRNFLGGLGPWAVKRRESRERGRASGR